MTIYLPSVEDTVYLEKSKAKQKLEHCETTFPKHVGEVGFFFPERRNLASKDMKNEEPVASLPAAYRCLSTAMFVQGRALLTSFLYWTVIRKTASTYILHCLYLFILLCS